MSDALDESTVVKHLTEWGLGLCFAKVTGQVVPVIEGGDFGALDASRRHDWFLSHGLRADTVACDGRQRTEGAWFEQVYPSASALATVPTCPRCAVLRDAALEGRLP